MSKPLDELLLEALELPAGPRRDAWIEAACGSDEALREELRELIRAVEDAPASFLKPLAGTREDEEKHDCDDE